MPAGFDKVYTLVQGGQYNFSADGTKLNFVGGASDLLPRTFHDDINFIGDHLAMSQGSKIGGTNEFIQFDPSNNNAISFFTVGVEDMRLDATGNLHVDRDVIAFSSTISDARLKENVQPIGGSLDVICNLQGVTFDWKNKKRGSNQPGLIAQEVEKFIPQSIQKHKLPLHTPEGDITEYKTIKYNMIVPYLIESIKELKSEIDDLKSKLENN